MSNNFEGIAEALKQARLAKGWSQRELGKRAHIPQSHISRIEAGAVDLQLSSLIELARTLELEVMLTPRAALPAVKSMVRQIGEDSAVVKGAEKSPSTASAMLEAAEASPVRLLALDSARRVSAMDALHLATGMPRPAYTLDDED
jgi:transcriptional regulator with XRE-family HTH domain